MKRIAKTLLLFALIWLGGLLSHGSAAKTYWRWTPKADYHEAVVRVKQAITSSMSSGGTGCVVWRNDQNDCLVATAHHVVKDNRQASVAWADGRSATFTVVAADAVNDGAILYGRAPDAVKAVCVATVDPAVGTAAEVCGYGGWTDRLRHFAVKITDCSGPQLKTDAVLLSGDSGGPVFADGVLVGITDGGDTYLDVGIVDPHGHSWPIHWYGNHCGPAAIRNLMATALRAIGQPTNTATGCYRGMCVPAYGSRQATYNRYSTIQVRPLRGVTIRSGST